MTEGKSPVDRISLVGKEIVEIAEFIDFNGMLIAEGQGFLVEIILDFVENLCQFLCKISSLNRDRLFMGFIAAREVRMFRPRSPEAQFRAGEELLS